MAEQIAVVGGGDTHTDFHQAAVIDSIGRHLSTESFRTNSGGCYRLLDWLRSRAEYPCDQDDLRRSPGPSPPTAGTRPAPPSSPEPGSVHPIRRYPGCGIEFEPDRL